jgi:general secretion pathway protein A
MYENVFRLLRNPFALTADLRFPMTVPGQRRALDEVLNAVLRRKGLILVSGAAGTGKTMLLNTIAMSVPPELAQIAVLRFPALDREEFLEMLLLELGVAGTPGTKPRKLVALERHLRRARERGKVVAVLIDEAHLAAPAVIEEICLLTNLEAPEGKLLQIVLAGQNELEDRFAQEPLRSFQQRIACRVRLEPLDPGQAAAYVKHRWKQAGGTHRR